MQKSSLKLTTLRGVFLLLVFAISCVVHSHAKDFTYDGIKYTTLTDSTCETKQGDFQSEYVPGSKVSGDLVIPDTAYDSEGKAYAVSKIGFISFVNSPELTSVSIPNSVIAIGEQAFQGCTGLTSVSVGNSVTSTGTSSFQNCSALTTVSLGDSVTSIGFHSFSGCTALTSITIPNTVTKIWEGAFSGCSNLTSLTIPDSVIEIGRYAFSSCSGLTTLTISNSVTEIGNSVFSYCSGLTTLTIPNSVTEIKYGAFMYCDKLVSVNLSDSLATIGESAFEGCMSLPQIDLPETLTEIGARAFRGCSSLSGLLSIPKGLTKIPKKAFTGTNYSICEVTGDKLVELTINDDNELDPSNSELKITHPLGNISKVIVPSSMASAYRDSNWSEYFDIVSNSGIEASVNITAPGNLAKDIATQTRKAPASVNKLIVTGGEMNADDFRVIKDNMTACFDLDLSGAVCDTIPENALSGKQVLQSVVLPNSTTMIGENAFADCMSLKSVTIGNKVTEIGASAFSCAYSLKNIKMSAALTAVGEYAFNKAMKLESISFVDNVETIGSNAFYSCTSLTDVSFGNSPAAIGNRAFSGCTSLSNLSFSDAIKSVGSEAFFGCTSLKDVVLPNSVTYIPEMAFQNCTSLSNIVLPDALTSIGSSSFQNCKTLSNIAVPATVKSIGDFAFCTSGLVSVDLSALDDMTAIETATFSRCDKLESVALPKNISEVCDSAFVGCASLVAADMSETKVSKVGEYAFSGCSKLASISLPETTEELGESAFSGCRKLQSLSITAMTPPAAQSTTFKSVSNETCSLVIPTNAFYDYLVASYWGSFVEIKSSFDIEIEGDDASLDYEVFDNEADAKEYASSDNAARSRSISRIKAKSSNLSDGISLFVPSSKTVRFHALGNADNIEVSVFLNDVDVTNSLVNGYLILSNFGDVNTLKIKSKISGVEDVTTTDRAIDANTIVDVYNLSGVAVMRGVEMGSIDNLSAGIYIVRSANATKKIIIK